MQTHIIENNVVTNTIVATVAEALAAFPDAVCIDAEQYKGGIGWTWDGEQLTAPVAPELGPTSSVQIDAERDRRIDAGFMFGGKLIQSRGDDRENIAGAALAAFMALSSGVAPDDLGWENDGEDFYWITQDNTMLPLGPQGVIDLGLAATAHKAAHIRAGFALKEMEQRPADYADDSYWPAVPDAEPVITARPA